MEDLHKEELENLRKHQSSVLDYVYGRTIAIAEDFLNKEDLYKFIDAIDLAYGNHFPRLQRIKRKIMSNLMLSNDDAKYLIDNIKRE